MTSSPAVVPRLSTVEALDKYLQKSVGRDMMLKSIVYPLRLWSYHSKDETNVKVLSQVVVNIIDARMLGNAWKWIGAYLTGYRTALSSEAMPWYQRILLSLSFFFRCLEQLAGDTGYIQKHIMTKQWSRPRISWHYKFWKTMSLTCAALLELIKIVTLQMKRRHLRRFVAQSPLTASPSMQPVSFPPPSSCLKLDDDEEMVSAQRWSMLFLFRNVCDMIVYYQWIESYRPNRSVEYICGFLSGSIGMWLVWRDIVTPGSHGKPGGAA